MHGISSNPENKKKITEEKVRFMKEKFKKPPLLLLKSIIYFRENYRRIKSIPFRINRMLTSITNNQ